MAKIEPKPLDELDKQPEVEVYHSLTATDVAANKNYLQRDPYSLVLPWDIKWPSIPAMPAYPEALVADARFSQNEKMKLKMIITDPSYFKKLWTQDSRAQYVEQYIDQLQKREKYYERVKLENLSLAMDRITEARLNQFQLMLEARAMIFKIQQAKRQK